MEQWNRCFGTGAVLFINIFLFIMFFAENARGDLLKQNKIQQSQPTKELNHQELIQKTQKLQMPFIANEGHVGEGVAFYAKTFGSTVFVTKNGDIVYSLPSRDVPAGASQAHSQYQEGGRGEDKAGEQRGGGAEGKNRVRGKSRKGHLDRLSENAKFKKSGVDIKGLMTREFAKIPILGQPVDY